MRKVAETVFVCSNCGNEFSKWQGQCSACGEWNSLKEVKNLKSKGSKVRMGEKAEIKNLWQIEEQGSADTNDNIFSSNIREFDRVLGKGLVKSGVVLFTGEPGIGKSTLLTQLVGKVGGLYVAGEEGASQIGMRVRRLGLDEKKFDILETNDLETVEEALERTTKKYDLVVIDSIQTIQSVSNMAMVGSVNQIRENTFRLIQLAKRKKVAMVIVGHVTKEGEVAGPKILEHMVDVVLNFEGERNSDLRMLRATKNRFGPTDEVGVFKMEEKGLVEVRADEICLTSNKNNQIGSAMTVVIEGSRPMLLEIQALVVESFAPMPKRVFSGIDYNRGQLMLAVAQKVLNIPLYKYDVFLAVGGGLKINDAGADLAIVGAVWSSYKNKPLGAMLKGGMVLVGEVTLLGEVRKVKGYEKRKKEIESLGKVMIDIGNVRELGKVG